MVPMDVVKFAQGVVMYRHPDSVADAKHSRANPPPVDKQYLTKPTIVADQNGKIVMIYLPGILPLPIQVGCLPFTTLNTLLTVQDLHIHGARLVEPAAHAALKSTSQCWRMDPQFNHSAGTTLLPGYLSLSPAYYAQGHVSNPSYLPHHTNLAC